MIAIKEGANVRDLHPKVWEIVYEASDLFAEFDSDCIITSGLDSKHSQKSLHYLGFAVDLRTRNIDIAHAKYIVSKLRLLRDELYDIILEEDHIHIEYDPRHFLWTHA